MLPFIDNLESSLPPIPRAQILKKDNWSFSLCSGEQSIAVECSHAEIPKWERLDNFRSYPSSNWSGRANKVLADIHHDILVDKLECISSHLITFKVSNQEKFPATGWLDETFLGTQIIDGIIVLSLKLVNCTEGCLTKWKGDKLYFDKLLGTFQFHSGLL